MAIFLRGEEALHPRGHLVKALRFEDGMVGQVEGAARGVPGAIGKAECPREYPGEGRAVLVFPGAFDGEHGVAGLAHGVMDVVNGTVAVGGGPFFTVELYPAALHLQGDEALEFVEEDDVALPFTRIVPGDGMKDVIGFVEAGHAGEDLLLRIEAGVEVVEAGRV